VEQGGAYSTMTLGDYLLHKSYSNVFMDLYLIPMGAAIWSATRSVMKNFPLQFFVRFFKNHGLLSVKNRPQWYVIKGGSRSYLKPLTQPFASSIRLNSPVLSIIRGEQGVDVLVKDGQTAQFDQVVIACHSDQALAMLSDASDIEQSILSAIPYQLNDVVLHTDTALLPRNRLTWSSWNYRILKHNQGEAGDQTLPVLSYHMNILQSIESEDTFCVTLNKTDVINPEHIIGQYQYAHPVFSLEAIEAQQRWSEINGVNRTWFCGAYWANGFHEDGVSSALKVTEALGESLSGI
ncbi:MAG: FAD-dependent oxidoreductase, partial [Pseudomonadota bacterium]